MRTATYQRAQQGPLRQFLRVVRGLAEASLVVVAFALAILLLGLPIALAVRAVQGIVSWCAGFA